MVRGKSAVILSLILAFTPFLFGFLPSNNSRPATTATPFDSVFAERQPVIDGVVSSEEWQGATQLKFTNGTLYILNDSINLYLLLDVTADHSENNLADPLDNFQVFFDIDRDGSMTPDVDLNYTLDPSTHSFCVQAYQGPGWEWKTCSQPDSQMQAGFGPTPLSSTSHRFWELALGLPELSANPVSTLRFGIGVYSFKESIGEYFPVGSNLDFSSMLSVDLVVKPADLLILAHENFIDELIPLVEHKEHTGLESYLQSWQSIDVAYQALGRDSAERVKKAIVTYEQYNQTLYVMLVGDVDRFPVRFFTTDHNLEKYFYRSFVSTDLYYADLYEGATSTFESWDANDNGYYGENYGGFVALPLNYDEVDLHPDVSVGRVPASTDAEVTTYVNKVIRYEFNSYKADWAKTALLVAVNANDLPNLCEQKETILANSLTPLGYSAVKLYQGTETYTCPATDPVTAANINSYLSQGVGFFNFMGHGNVGQLGSYYYPINVTGSNNQNVLPITFAAACLTGKFANNPPTNAYTDIYGVYHLAGSTFTEMPPPPDPIQDSAEDFYCMAEAMITEHDQGAVGYIGCAMTSQAYGFEMDALFFESLEYGADTLGRMRNYMVDRYYALHSFPEIVDPLDWHIPSAFHHPWKFNLFGDPSLRIHGVSQIVQKADFVGSYSATHDGWQSSMQLESGPDMYIESLPNILGVYTDGNGGHDLRGYVRTWQYPIPESEGPDWKMNFFVDFPGTPNQSDDQKFEAYLFTQDKAHMAGITWWGTIPFGFYAHQDTMGNLSQVQMGLPSSSVSMAAVDISKSDFLGNYAMNHDGWIGNLYLYALPDGKLYDPNIGGIYTDDEGSTHQVRGMVRTPTYLLPPGWGPDHKIVFDIDVNDTSDPDDDLAFEGYLFTQTRSAMAGVVVLFDNYPHGFYAEKLSLVYLPVVFR